MVYKSGKSERSNISRLGTFKIALIILIKYCMKETEVIIKSLNLYLIRPPKDTGVEAGPAALFPLNNWAITGAMFVGPKVRVAHFNCC
jgi:hypothetical protein